MMIYLMSSITQIIFDVNWHFMQLVQTRFQYDPSLLSLMEQSSIFSNDHEKRVCIIGILNNQVRMANLCIVGSHRVNGVSVLHTQILRDSIFNVFHRIYPEQIVNVTNGITPRRWLLQCNPCMS